jgi:PhnB protein
LQAYVTKRAFPSSIIHYTMSTDLSHIPAGYHSITPSLTVRDGPAALAFYTKAFGAVELYRLPEKKSGKIMHAEFRIGNSNMMLSDEYPEWGALAPAIGKGGSFLIYVTDADAAFEQAIASGATEMMKPTDQFWGDRSGVVADPFGYRWNLAQRVKEVSPEELEKLADSFQPGS